MKPARHLRVVPKDPAPAPPPRPKPLGMTRPVIRAWVHGEPVENVDGRQAVENMTNAAWSSFLTRRGTRRDHHDLADLHGLARAIHLSRLPTSNPRPPLLGRWWAGLFSRSAS